MPSTQLLPYFRTYDHVLCNTVVSIPFHKPDDVLSSASLTSAYEECSLLFSFVLFHNRFICWGFHPLEYYPDVCIFRSCWCSAFTSVYCWCWPIFASIDFLLISIGSDLSISSNDFMNWCCFGFLVEFRIRFSPVEFNFTPWWCWFILFFYSRYWCCDFVFNFFKKKL